MTPYICRKIFFQMYFRIKNVLFRSIINRKLCNMYSVEITSLYWLFKKLALQYTEVRFTSISPVDSLLLQSSSDILRRPPKFGISSTFFHIIKGQTKSKRFLQADVSSKKRTNKFYFTTMKTQVDLFL